MEGLSLLGSEKRYQTVATMSLKWPPFRPDTEQDLQASEVLLSAARPFPYPACFHAQQTAEKCLKAVLTWHQVEFPKTRAIEELLDLVGRAGTRTWQRASRMPLC